MTKRLPTLRSLQSPVQIPKRIKIAMTNLLDAPVNGNTTDRDLKADLIAHLNEYDLTFTLEALADIADEAAKTNPGFAWAQDARLIRSIIPKIEN
jgi:hypothetical protein